MWREDVGQAGGAAADSSSSGVLGVWSSKTPSCYERVNENFHSVGLHILTEQLNIYLISVSKHYGISSNNLSGLYSYADLFERVINIYFCR